MDSFFGLVDLGPISWLLRVSVSHDPKNQTIALGQETYVNQILVHFGLDKARPASTPMEPGINLTPDSPAVSPILLTPAEKTTYQKMIGSLMYLLTMTCPDITFAISTLSQYLNSPHVTHFGAVRCVFKYLAGTKHLHLTLGGHHLHLEARLLVS